MTKQKLSQRLTILTFIFSLFLPLSSFASSGTILSAYKYAWSDQVGYINFAPAQGGVTITDTTLSGYVWSENTGYINFAPAQAGVHNDGTGNLSGFAWGEGVGYIDFDGVTIGPPIGNTRKFSGTATGTVIGTINFDCAKCDVRTDWKTSSSGSSGGRIPLNPTVNGTPFSTPPKETASVCPIYMYKYIKLGSENDPKEVIKLQIFLRDYEGFNDLSVSGIYDQITYEAVKQFQAKYAGDVLSPWGTSKPTGYVFKTTIKKINELYCKYILAKNNLISGSNETTNNTINTPSSPNLGKSPIVSQLATPGATQPVQKSFFQKVVDFLGSIIVNFFKLFQ